MIAVHVWSDIVCPWCFVGKRRFEAALQRFQGTVEITWHSFELDFGRAAERRGPASAVERLALKLGCSPARALALMEQMRETGAEVGIDFHLPEGKTLQSFDAHRLLHLAHELDLQGALKERLFRAHFEEALDCGAPQVLIELVTEIGIDSALARSVLESDRFSTEVRADEQLAQELGITGVPFFAIGRYGVHGAQSPDVFVDALERAQLEESMSLGDTDTSAPEDASCVDGACRPTARK